MFASTISVSGCIVDFFYIIKYTNNMVLLSYLAELIKGTSSLHDLTFSDYLKMFLFNKDVPYGNYFDYIDYMWSLRNNPNMLIIYFEDLKLVRKSFVTLLRLNIASLNLNHQSELDICPKNTGKYH